MGSFNPIYIVLAVILAGALFFVGFAPLKTAIGVTEKFMDINYERTPGVIRTCKDFESDLFLKLAFFEKSQNYENYNDQFRNQGFFFEGDDDMYFRKVKLFCGAVGQILDSIKGGNTIEVVYGINQTYKIYPGFELDADEILSIVAENEGAEDVWVANIINLIGHEVEAID